MARKGRSGGLPLEFGFLSVPDFKPVLIAPPVEFPKLGSNARYLNAELSDHVAGQHKRDAAARRDAVDGRSIRRSEPARRAGYHAL
jgi:hypothetical protein